MNKTLSIAVGITLLTLLLSSYTHAQAAWPANQPPDPWANVQGPRYGGTFRIGSVQEPVHLNPTISASGVVSFMGGHIYMPLTRYGLNTVWEPELAYAWETSSDGNTWTFHLYENATWHDGKPLTSADVMYSWDVFTHNSASGFSFRPIVKSVEAPDDHTWVMHFNATDVGWQYNFCLFVVVPKHVYDVPGVKLLDNPANRKPVGSGPWKFVEWKAGEYIHLTRYDKFYQKALPYLDDIYFVFAPSPRSVWDQWAKGDIDFIAYATPSYPSIAQYREKPIAGKYPGAYGTNKWGISEIAFNYPGRANSPKYTANKIFRQAVAYAIDYNRIIRDCTFNIPMRQYTLFPVGGPNAWSYNPNAKHYEYDPAKANQLLDQLGYKWDAQHQWRLDPNTGQPVTLKYVIGAETAATEGAIHIDNLKDVGIKVDQKIIITQAENAILFNDYDFDIAWWNPQTGADVSRIETWIGSAYIIKGAATANWERYSNKEVDNLFYLAKQTYDRKQRAQHYWKIQDIWADEVPIIPVYAIVREMGWSQSFKGQFYPMNISMHQDPMKWIWSVNGKLPTPPAATTPKTTAAPSAPAVDTSIIALAVVGIVVLAGIGFYMSKRKSKK